jgi:hypothetical protein
MPAKISAAIRQRAARIKLFLCELDKNEFLAIIST